jgi:4-carboxymuconolactone decarboxylase
VTKHQQRRDGGIDVLRTLGGGAFDPERAARAMVRNNGALGSFGVDHVLGTLWNRPQLSRRDRSLIVVTFLTALNTSGGEEFAFHIRSALNHGLSRAEVEEIVLQVATYAGFPIAMQASRVVNEIWQAMDELERPAMRGESALLDDDARHANAQAVRSAMWNGRNATDPAADRSAIVDALGGVGEMAFDYAFGEVWARDVLSRRDRSMVTIAILAVTHCTDELKIHVRAGLNHGCKREEIEEIFVQMTGYAGFPKAVSAATTARELFARIDAKASANG